MRISERTQLDYHEPCKCQPRCYSTGGPSIGAIFPENAAKLDTWLSVQATIRQPSSADEHVSATTDMLCSAARHHHSGRVDRAHPQGGAPPERLATAEHATGRVPPRPRTAARET